MIKIKDLHKIGSGDSKNVYLHPEDADKLIKVMRRDVASPDGGFSKHNALKRSLHQGIYRQFRREILQFLQLCKSNYADNIFSFPMEKPFGFVKTDHGLGLVVERITGPSGNGETLSDLCEKGEFSSKHAQALENFFNNCSELHLVFGEVNAAGILYTERRSGRPEFVLVDGIGEKLLIPVRAMSKRINSRYVRKVEQRIKKELMISYGAPCAQ